MSKAKLLKRRRKQLKSKADILAEYEKDRLERRREALGLTSWDKRTVKGKPIEGDWHFDENGKPVALADILTTDK